MDGEVVSELGDGKKNPDSNISVFKYSSTHAKLITRGHCQALWTTRAVSGDPHGPAIFIVPLSHLFDSWSRRSKQRMSLKETCQYQLAEYLELQVLVG